MSSLNGKINFQYLNEAAQIFEPIKQKSYRNMQIDKGDCVLDVGCGPGIDAIALGGIVSPDGKVIGVDHDREMIIQAENQTRSLGLGDFISFLHSNVYELPFVTNNFDSCRSERLFMHLAHPEQALSEIQRVTKPGGRVVIVETDWNSLSIDCQETQTEQLLGNYRINRILANGYSGRSLYRLFKRHNFSNITIEIFPLYTSNLQQFYALSLQETVENQALAEQIINCEELEVWKTELKKAASEETFFCSVNIIMVTGVKSEKV